MVLAVPILEHLSICCSPPSDLSKAVLVTFCFYRDNLWRINFILTLSGAVNRSVNVFSKSGHGRITQNSWTVSKHFGYNFQPLKRPYFGSKLPRTAL